jgi:hypothetical protein
MAFVRDIRRLPVATANAKTVIPGELMNASSVQLSNIDHRADSARRAEASPALTSQTIAPDRQWSDDDDKYSTMLEDVATILAVCFGTID